MQAEIKFLGYSGMDIIIAASIKSDQGPKTPLCVGSLIQIDEIYPQEARPALEEPPLDTVEQATTAANTGMAGAKPPQMPAAR